MKFLCDNCKAKYQIGDDKVAGKTVRMKCRKCGHPIEVRAEVTESSVARPPPRSPSGPPSQPPARSALATSLSATKPRVPSTSTAPSSALAGAFKSNLQDAPPSSTNDALLMPASLGDEWYVAINGVPVGPVRLSELRRKAASGAVTEESLCWQEGLEEWRPIRSIPELAALVREAAQVGRPSMISTPEPMVAPPPPPPRPSLAPRPPSPSVAPPTPRSLAPLASPTGRSNVVPLRPAASGPSSLEEVTVAKVIGLGPGAAAALAPSVPTAPPAPAAFAAFAAPETAVDPFAVPLPAPAAVPSPLLAPSMEEERLTSGGPKIPLWFWLVLLPAMGFGITVAVMVFRPQAAHTPVVVQVPAPSAAATETATRKAVETAPSTPTPEPSAPPTADTKGKTGPVAVKGPTPKADVPEKKGIDLGGLVPNGGGPNVGPNASPGAGGGGLDPAGVERVVASHRNGVKRTCWERGGPDQKSSVNITVAANVAPNGTVASTSSTGDDPVVAKCIEGQVRSWQFPAPGTNTQVNIPFKFVRQ